jgi:uncharacterized protein (DUF302 family)
MPKARLFFVRFGKLLTFVATIFLLGDFAMAADGLTTVASSFAPKETMDRLEAEIAAKGLTLFARIDHSAGAAEVGLTLRPTVLFIFGNAKGGTPLMQAAQTAGIDLPLKVLVWQDEKGVTQVSFNDPAWIAKRHGAENDQVVNALTGALHAIVQKSTTSQ